MTSPTVAPLNPRPESGLLPDQLMDPGMQFAVEWQVVERIQRYPVPQPLEARDLS